MLEIEHLSVSYGPVNALSDVSLSAPPAAITAVLGANGAGKTTLLRTVSGLVRKSSGSIRFEGREISGLPPEEVVRLGIAHVPEGRGVIAELTVEENLRLGALVRRGRARGSGGVDAFELFPVLADRRKRPATTLSGGERQMLAIARALASSPSVLLLDEPSLGLAPRISAELTAVIGRLAHDDGLAVVLVEQNARSALSVADHALVLNLGRVVLSDAADAINSDDELVRHYLGFELEATS